MQRHRTYRAGLLSSVDSRDRLPLRAPLGYHVLLFLTVCIFLIAPGAYCDKLHRLKWETPPDSFRFHIATESPIRFVIGENSPEPGCFSLEILDIDELYEGRSLDFQDPRIRKILIQSLPEKERVRLIFHPNPGIQWNVLPGKDLTQITVELKTRPKDAPVASSNTNSQSFNQGEKKKPSQPKDSLPFLFNPRGADAQSGNNSGSFPPGSQSERMVRNPGSSSTEIQNRKLVIVDPGHGGFNKGARTSRKINGKHYFEKDLVLEYGKKLKYLIQKSPNLKVLMTREEDVYVSLSDRVEFAQNHEGDLFVSLHLNSSPNAYSRTARGFEIFHWRETGSNNAAGRYLEKLENDQLLPKLPKTENRHLKRILTNMLKDALEEEKTRSAKVCNVMGEVLQKSPYFRRYYRKPPVKSARFVVLANYAMPAVLIEVGFLSNAGEAKYLISDSFQWTTVRLLYNGIQKFFAQEDPEFKPHYIHY